MAIKARGSAKIMAQHVCTGCSVETFTAVKAKRH